MESVTHRLFGTDGVRGSANTELTPELVLALARAIVRATIGAGERVVVGRDTRTSGTMLEAALVAGLTASGVEVLLAGVVPTPAISFLIKDEKARLGAVISASHNPPSDNGVKLFDEEGLKLSTEVEEAIEREMRCPGTVAPVDAAPARRIEAAATRYAAFLTGSIEIDEVDLAGCEIVVDCAFGATGSIAPRVLQHFNAKVIGLHMEPAGERINQGCGVEHLEPLRDMVLERRADLGIAFDGDGDRVLLLTAEGDLVDGDVILGAAALHLHRTGRLHPPMVVATVQSNLGLERALAAQGITLLRTPVGDRHVARAMRAHRAKLGGEKSGHVIFGEHSPTGDGLLTAVKMLEIAHEQGRTLSEIAREIPLVPQEQRSIEVDDAEALLAGDDAVAAVRDATERLGRNGRLLVRPSGTQSKLRVMVESDDPELCHSVCDELVDRLAGVASRSVGD